MNTALTTTTDRNPTKAVATISILGGPTAYIPLFQGILTHHDLAAASGGGRRG